MTGDDVLTEHPEQLWQVPARIALEHGVSDGTAALLGQYLADNGLITVDTARPYLAAHPEHAPDL